MPRINVVEDGDSLVEDARLERVFYLLQRLVSFPDGLGFVAKRQEPLERNEDNPAQPAQAVFVITSPHPKANAARVLSPHQLVSIASMPYSRWVEANKEYKHYAGLTDPLRPIFAGLLKRHLEKHENLKAII